MKPERRIYEILLERLCVDAYEAVLIDDIKEYVSAAQDIGMNGILFESSKQVMNELVLLGIKID